MAKILFIAPYPQDGAPSQRFRFEQYFSILREEGHELELASFFTQKQWAKLYLEGKTLSKACIMLVAFARRFLLLFKIRKYDFIFIHREAAMIGPPFFEWFIAKVLRKKFIYDFDDAIWLANYSEANARFQGLKMYGKVRRIIKWADRVTVGNSFLAAYAHQFNSKVEVIPTSIDLAYQHNREGNPHQKPLVIGWTGTHTTGRYLQDLLPVLDELAQSNSFIFRVISNQAPDFNRPYLEFVKWNKSSEIEDLASFNIGVMPLEDSDWARGKCGFKGLQYMALGIPALLSPVGVNTEIIQDGVNGFLCDSQEVWLEKLALLLQDADLRNQIGAEGKATIRNCYSVEANKTKYLNLFR